MDSKTVAEWLKENWPDALDGDENWAWERVIELLEKRAREQNPVTDR